MISNKKFIVILFSVLFCLIYFNPLRLPNEIWPFFIIPTLFSPFLKNELILYFFMVVMTLFCFYIYEYPSSLLIDLFQVIVVFRACFFVSLQEKKDIVVMCKIFKSFVVLSVAFGILQLLDPGFLHFSNTFFSGRGDFMNKVIEERGASVMMALNLHIRELIYQCCYSYTVIKKDH